MVLVLASLLGALLVFVATPGPAVAAGTVLFQNTFASATVNGTGTGTVSVPTAASGPNTACLTARGNSTTGPLLSCSGSIDAAGSGKLRLTSASTNQIGGVFSTGSIPTSSGLDVTFNSYQWGGVGADGIAFMLAAVDPVNPVTPGSVGPPGGALGYSRSGTLGGLPHGYLGVGLDVFGNFSSTGFQGTGCASVPNITDTTPGAAVVRGPGNGQVGYCGLSTTWNGTAASKATLHAATRAASAVPVQVLVNPTGASFTSDTGVAVSAGTYKVVVKPVGQTAKTLSGPLPAAAPALYPSASWLNANGVPKRLAFGFVGSTGSVVDTHEISDVKVQTFTPVAQLSVATTSYSAAAPAPGAPVNYSVTAGVLAGGAVSSPISVTQTVPVGVVPSAAYGSGWVCQAPVGRTVSCTTTASSFAAGSTLPAITVVGIVTGAGMTASLIQNGSPAQASATDASSATDQVATAGTPAAAPNPSYLLPTTGSADGDGTVYVGYLNSNRPTAIMIGTVAEQQAGTPVVLLPCTAGQATSCFTVTSSALITISHMPGRDDAATTRVTVVTLGAAGFYVYVYYDKPDAPAAPTATAGVNSVTLTWTAPDNNGSALTDYVVTPYLDGVAQPGQSFDDSIRSHTFAGLEEGGSWTYTVAAVNAHGTSSPSAESDPVVPYALPDAPTVTAVSARNSAVLMSWTPNGDGGRAITGYVVTPWIGDVAQATRTFGPGTTQTVSGLSAGTAYTFTVAAVNLAGTGPASARTAAVTPNSSPSLSFPAPPAGQVGVPYSHQLSVTNGTAPFVWSLASGALPAGLTLNPSTGTLAGTPTAAGSTTFTVKVVDTSGETATRSVTLVVTAAPVLTFAPAAGQVGVAYSQQPVVTGGTAPYTWAVSAGSLPAGVTINASTGLVSGTPTASGSFSITVSATDSLDAVAGKTVVLVVTARPTFAAGAPPTGQVAVAYTTTFPVTGGTAPLTWSISAGSAPSGLTLDPSNGTLAGTPTTQGSYTFTVAVVDARDQTATKTVTLVVGAGPLVIRKVADVSSTTAGSTVGYTITIANTGATARTGVSVQDVLTGVLDDAAYDQNATATSGAVTYSASTLGWTGSVAAGATVTVAYSVTVATSGTGNKTLSNAATSATPGTNCAAASSDSRCSSAVTVAGLTMVATADTTSTTPGSTVRYQVVVTNTGPVPSTGATFALNLAGVLDDATYTTDAAATSGSVSFTGSSLTWTGTLAAGASATVTYSVSVKVPDTGNRSLSSTVVSPSAGSSCPGGNPAATCTVTVPVLVPALVISHTASVSTTTPGATVPYTLTVSNTGQTPYSAASVSVALAAVLDDATYDGNAASSSGSVGYTSGTLTWSGNLATGAVATITYSVTVREPDGGNRTLTSAATSSAPGSTCPAASPAPACTSNVQVLVPGLTITASAGDGSTTPGSVVTHTVVATNTGQTAYASATFATSLSGVLDDATYDGNASATTGAVSYAGPTITWTGPLAVGATVTLTYSVTVRSPDPGDRSLVTSVASTTAGSNCAAASSDPRCRSTVAVRLPGLSLVTSVDAVTTTPGGVVRYTLDVTNTGETTQQDVVVLIDLTGAFDDATSNQDALVSTGSQAPRPDGTSAWTLSLAPGASATASLSVTVKEPDAGDRMLRTRVWSAAAGSTCPSGSPNPDCTSAVSVLVPGLTITKSADTATVLPGASVGYTITVANNGQTAYPAASFTDDLTDVLTDATYAGDATASSGSVSYGSPTLSWTGALAPGASATIAYSITVLDPAPGDKFMTNAVVSTSKGSNCAVGSTDTRCRAAVQVKVPGLTIAKSADRATTKPGDDVVYTVTVTNSGATAYVGATFDDSLVGVLDDAAYVADSAVATGGSVGYAGSTLTWTGNLAVGASVTVTYSVRVRSADGGDNLLTNQVVSGTRGANCAVGSSDGRCRTTVAVARLELRQTTGAPTTTPGAVVVVTGSFTNTGQVPYLGIRVVSPRADTSDDTIPVGDQTASSGAIVRTATEVIWTGNIPVGGTVTTTRGLTVKKPDPGNRNITATLSSTAPGNNCLDGTADPLCTFAVAVLVPALTIVKATDVTAAAPGETVGYTISVTNTGETPYTDVVVTDALDGVLDDAEYDGNATATTGVVEYSSPALTWTGSLAPGAAATIAYSVTVKDPATGDKTMINPVSSTATGSTCLPASATPQCRTTVDVLTPALTVTTAASRPNATLGTPITFTVTATNTGQTTYDDADVTSSLAEVLDDATYGDDAAATSGTVAYESGQLAWSGSLVPDAAVTITYTGTINNPDTGDGELVTTVASTDSGSNCAAASTDERCSVTVTVTNSVSITFEKTADVETTVAGAVVDYTITVTNSDSILIGDATLTDPLAEILDDADYNDDATSDLGSVALDGSSLVWSGDLPATTTATITYSVTVHTALGGDDILDGTITSGVLAESDNCAVASDDPRCTSTVAVAGLRIQQTAGAPTATPGSAVVVTQTFTNTGQVPYAGISIISPRADTSDDTIPVGDQTVSSGTLVRTPTEVIWTGDIPVGGSVMSTRTLTVKDPVTANKIITATLHSTAPGNNCPTGSLDPSCTFRVDVVVPGLTIEKTASATTAEPGDVVVYTISVTNTGETSYPAAVVSDALVGVLDDGTYDGNADATSGTLDYTSSTLTWTGALAPADDVTITYSVTVKDPATGDKTMINPVSSTEVGSTCPPAGQDPLCNTNVHILTPQLVITTEASAATTRPGAAVTYTVTAHNTGQTAYAAASLSVPLDEVLDDATYGGDATATAGSVEVTTGDTLEWSGPLGLDDVATITYSVTVDEPPTGDFRLDQTVVSPTHGSTCPDPGSDPACTTSVPIASLRIVNSADVATAKPTDVVVNSVTVTNDGQVPYVDLVVNDSFVGSLDDATYNGDATASAGMLLLVTGTGQVRWTGSLAPGESLLVTGSLTVNNPPAGNRNLSTIVTTSAAATNCPVTGGAAECATSVPVLLPQLTVTKVADTASTAPGATVAYTITATNTGETDYTDATVTDALAGILNGADYNGDATAETGVVGYSASGLTWTGDLLVDDIVTISFTVDVHSPYLGDGTLENRVVSDELGSTCPTAGGAAACASTVPVLVPALEMAITADRSTTVPGGTVGYTLTVHNAGQSDYADASVTASLAGVLDDGSYGGDAAADVGTTAFTAPDLTWTGDLPVDATATITYTVTVADPPGGNLDLATSVTSAAPGSTCGSAPECLSSVTVLIPGLAVSTAADAATATPGDRVRFTTTVLNTGQTAYAATTLSSDLADVLDDAALDGGVSASVGVVDYSAPTVSWTGSLAPGESGTIGYTVTVGNPDAGDRLLSATVVADGQGSTCPSGSPNSACTATVQVLVPGLSIVKSAGAPTTTPGSRVDYSIAILNTGETAYAAATLDDSLEGVLTDAAYNDDAEVVGGGVLTYDASTLSWTGALPVGASATITYSVTVDQPDRGDKLMTNTVTSTTPGSTCPTADPAAACTAVVDVLVPALVVTKTASADTVVAGDRVVYTITATNTGETAYAPATVVDSLANVLDDAAYAGDVTASVGSVGYTDGTLIWTGPLAVGASATITYSVGADFPAAGDRSLANSALSTSPGSTCPTSDAADCTAVVAVLVPELTVSKTADTTAVAAGGTVDYTISATNTGEADYPAATLTDPLAGVLDDATYNDDASADTGGLGYSAGTLSWDGALIMGATVTITFSVTTVVEGAGDAILTNRVVSASTGSTCASDSIDPDCLTSTPVAARTIELSGLTPSVSLAGPPHTTVAVDGGVTMTVTTNSPAGYLVTVLAQDDELLGSTGNTDTVPLSLLGVRERGSTPWLPLSDVVPTLVHEQDTASAPEGDAVSNDYRLEIPNVLPDTYSTSLYYLVTAQ